MSKDNPDTLVMDDQVAWAETQVDEVFLPSVQVLLGWRDVEAAVSRGAVVPAEAHGLWASWAAPGSPLRWGAGSVDRAHLPAQANQIKVAQDDDLGPEPFQRPSSDGFSRAVMLLIGVAVGAALMFALNR